MVIVHAEHPESHGQIHGQAATAVVEAPHGGQAAGRPRYHRGRTRGPKQAGREQQRESPQGGHPAAMLGQKEREGHRERMGKGVMEVGGENNTDRSVHTQNKKLYNSWSH